MPHANRWFKVMAIASSVLLASGFIAFRVGALHRMLGLGPDHSQGANSLPTDGQLLPGSKSAPFTPVSAVGDVTPHVTPVEPGSELMGTSKSLMIPGGFAPQK